MLGIALITLAPGRASSIRRVLTPAITDRIVLPLTTSLISLITMGR